MQKASPPAAKSLLRLLCSNEKCGVMHQCPLLIVELVELSADNIIYANSARAGKMRGRFHFGLDHRNSVTLISAEICERSNLAVARFFGGGAYDMSCHNQGRPARPRTFPRRGRPHAPGESDIIWPASGEYVRASRNSLRSSASAAAPRAANFRSRSGRRQFVPPNRAPTSSQSHHSEIGNARAAEESVTITRRKNLPKSLTQRRARCYDIVRRPRGGEYCTHPPPPTMLGRVRSAVNATTRPHIAREIARRKNRASHKPRLCAMNAK